MFADACFGLHSADEIASDLRAFLGKHGLANETVEAICSAPARLLLYRTLVRNNLVGVTSKMMPRTRARLNALSDGAFEASFDEFLAEAGPRTHYLRDVPGEFLVWVTPRWMARGDIPRYIGDLATHEVVEFQVAALPVPEAPPPLGELALDRPLVFAEARRLMRYRFAVHELPEDPDDRSEPQARPVSLLVYRDAHHAIGSEELTPVRAALLDALFEGDPLGRAVAKACASAGLPVTDAFLVDAARLLATLAERGILLGAGQDATATAVART
jgi:hypothetical protein